MKYVVRHFTFAAAALTFAAASQAGKMPQLEAQLEAGQDTKIVFLGDSVTGGYGVSAADTYPRQFAKLLKQQYPNSNVLYYGKDLRIWPAGTYGAGTNHCQPAYSYDNVMTPEYVGGQIPGARTITVISDGIGGSNVARFLARLTNAPTEVTYTAAGYANQFRADDPFRPDVPYTARDADAIFMMFGINDSLTPINAGPYSVNPDAGLACYKTARYANVPLDTRGTYNTVFRYQYRQAIGAIRQQAVNNPEIGVITPNRVGNTQQNQFLTNYYANHVNGLVGWADAAFDVNAHFNAQTATTYNKWMVDVYHPSALGHQQIANLIFSQY